MTVKITFQPPEKNKPGFLKRQKQALIFQRELANPTPSPEALDLMVEFLADYVVEPKKRADAVAALWEASEEQFNEMMDALRGATSGENPVPPQ